MCELEAQGRQVISKLRFDSEKGDLQAIFTPVRDQKHPLVIRMVGPQIELTYGMGSGGGTFSLGTVSDPEYQLRLAPQDRANVIFNLSSLYAQSLGDKFPGKSAVRDLSPGRYQFQLATTEANMFGAPRVVEAPPVEMEVRDPSPAEAEWLQATQVRWQAYIREVRKLAGNDIVINGRGRYFYLKTLQSAMDWTALLNFPVALPEPSDLSLETQEVLAPYLFLISFVLTSNALEDYPLQKVEAVKVPASLESERQIWKYELLKARHQAESAAQLRKSVETQLPGMKWRLDEVDQGNGLLKTLVQSVYVPPVQK